LAAVGEEKMPALTPSLTPIPLTHDNAQFAIPLPLMVAGALE